jgi:hypothetical protein
MMLNDTYPTLTATRWNSMETPSRAAQVPAGYQLLLAALDAGWQIMPPPRLTLADENSLEPRYLVHLFNPLNGQSTHLLLSITPQVDALLLENGIAPL